MFTPDRTSKIHHVRIHGVSADVSVSSLSFGTDLANVTQSPDDVKSRIWRRNRYALFAGVINICIRVGVPVRSLDWRFRSNSESQLVRRERAVPPNEKKQCRKNER